MRRLVACLGIALLIAGSACAELEFTGTVVAGETLPILASYGGQITEILTEAGQMAAEGQILGEVGTTRNYAPIEGTVTGLYIAEGDKTEDITERYGASLYIEPTNRYTITATSDKAYNSSENQYVHLGERVYLKCLKNGVHRGTGMVSALTDKGYSIEVTGGDFSMQEKVGIFRSSDYSKESSLGRGTVGRTKPVAVKGTGSVLKIYVRNGDFVERGEILFETVDGILDGMYAPSGKIISPVNGIVSSVLKGRGETVTKNEILMKLIPTDSLRVEFQVQEADLFLIREGQPVEMTLFWDTEPGRTYEGEITWISHVQETQKEGTASTDRKSYKAYASIRADEQIRAGMTVNVALAREASDPAEPEQPAAETPAEEPETPAEPEQPAAETPAEEPETPAEPEQPAAETPAEEPEPPAEPEQPAVEEPGVPAAKPAAENEQPADSGSSGPVTFFGDKTLIQTDSESFTEYVERLIVIGTKVYIYASGSSQAFHVYDSRTGNTEIYDMKELEEKLQGGEERMRTEDGDLYTENVAAWFPWKGEIYAVIYRNIVKGDGSDIDGGYVRRLVLADGKASLEETDVPQLDWRQMIERNGASRYNRWTSSTASVGDTLALAAYGDSGDMELHLFNLETGTEEIAEIDGLEDVAGGSEGRLLIGRRDRMSDGGMIVELYDIGTKESEELARFKDMYSVRGISWRAENSTLYYVSNGEIFAAKDGDTENAVSVNDCGITPSRMLTEMTDDGLLAVYRYDGAMVRNTDPDRRGSVTIRIHPYAWSSGANAAYYAFTNARSDVGVVREEEGDIGTLLQSMMNRDDRVDIYTIDTSTSAYDAIYSRGFMGSLEGSGKLKAAIAKLYPFLQEACSKDGQLVAIPINMGGDTFGYHREVWTKLGFTEDDVPRTWDAYMDLLESLPEKLEGTEYRLFELWVTKQSFRSELMSAIVHKYALTRPDDGFDTPLLRRLLDRASKLDLDALGLIDEEESDDIFERYEALGGQKTAVLVTGLEVAMASYRQEYQTLILSSEEGEEAVLPASLSVAFLNPYSAHPQEAMAYLETMMETMDTTTAYSFNPELNEPVRYPDHEEQKKNMVKWIEEAKTRLNETEDEESRETLEKSIESLEKELAEYDETNWMISPNAITSYRARAQYIRPEGYDFWTMLYSGENGETFSTLWNGFLEGQKSAQDVLAFMDQKVQMMRMEGN